MRACGMRKDPNRKSLAEGALRIGTRASPLAIAQAELARRRIAQACGFDLDGMKLVRISTAGDLDTSRPFRELGGKGLFCKEIEAALLDGKIDMAVHSLKDMPVEQPEGLAIACVLPRADPRDALVSARYSRLEDMPAGSVVGTSSVRRRAQVMRLGRGIKVAELRGNVDTRLKKLADGAADGILIAMAGLERLGLLTNRAQPVPIELMLPAPGQGAVCIEARIGDQRVREILGAVNHPESMARTAAERAFLGRVGGSCDLPIGAHAEAEGSEIRLTGEVLRHDGSDSITASARGSIGKAAELGRRLAEQLLADMDMEFRDWFATLRA